MAMMFYHATRDTDQLVRRLYGYVGGIGLPLSGLILSLLPVIISWAKSAPEDGSPKPIVSLFFPFGWACFLAGLFFLIPFCRNESDSQLRRYGVFAMGLIGIGLALVGLTGGLITSELALTYGSVLALMGLGYLCAFISQLGGADLDGFRPALGVGVLGVLVFVIALVHSLTSSGSYFIPGGLMMMSIGLLYALTAVFLVSDLKIVVLTRRELLAYFCSPIAYMLIFISSAVAWVNYNQFVALLASRPLMEPVVLYFYLGTLYGVFMLIFQVPALTMRAFSEEKRTGTYEVLMCAPVSETPVVISKLLAALAFYMLIWAVWLVFLLHIRVETGKAFEYRIPDTFTDGGPPALLSWHGALLLQPDPEQIVAAALTFFMAAWIIPHYVLSDLPEESTRYMCCSTVLRLLVDRIASWSAAPANLIIQLSLTVFWCFLTVRVESRRRLI